MKITKKHAEKLAKHLESNGWQIDTYISECKNPDCGRCGVTEDSSTLESNCYCRGCGKKMHFKLGYGVNEIFEALKSIFEK